MAGESTLETEVRSSVHPIHSRSTELSGGVEGSFDGEGRPDVTQPHRAHIELPVRSVASGNRLNDGEMLRRVEAQRYPTLAFDVADVRKAEGGQDGAYVGTITVEAHGRTRKQEVTFRLAVDGDRLTVDADHTFDMRDFGLQPPRIFTLKVEPEVRVTVHVVARESDHA
ncbi:MAG: YceI family protein [Candidatus Dormibacteraeota bacterium]|nr:YceI family protein [Candidatus Dormibacteraeota bacterium]